MARLLYDSPYIFGIHDPGGEEHMVAAGRPGWLVFTVSIGHDANDRSGQDFSRYSQQGLGVICRLNNGYYPAGTIPSSRHYAAFARRCANFVTASRGCKIWIIGNETNYVVERPHGPANSVTLAAAVPTTPLPVGEPARPSGPWAAATSWVRGVMGRGENGLQKTAVMVEPALPALLRPPEDDLLLRARPERFNVLHGQPAGGGAVLSSDSGEPITPAMYARCYRLCRDAIHSMPGHGDDQVLVGAVAPWNNQTRYAGNPHGDWVQYFKDILSELGPHSCDGFTIHAYTHQPDPNLIYSDAKMARPFEKHHYEFRVYRDFMEVVPRSMRHLPAYITETDQDVAWADQNSSWVQRVYAEINWWNSQPGRQQIRALILYRWPRLDRWYIEGKDGVIADFKLALAHDYRWQVAVPPAAAFKVGDWVVTTTQVNLRATPGHVGKPAADTLLQVPAASHLTILDEQYRVVDGLVWWQVKTTAAGLLPEEPQAIIGWLAQFDPAGVPLLSEAEGPGVPPPAPPPAPAPVPAPPPQPAPDLDMVPGARVRTLAVVRLRRSPGYRHKPAGDILSEVAMGSVLRVLAGPRPADQLIWWEVERQENGTGPQRGWMAVSAPDGQRLLERIADSGDPPPADPPAPAPPAPLRPGDRARTLAVVRLRRTPGYVAKPEGDILIVVPIYAEVTILQGPRTADGLTWWWVRTAASEPLDGWMAAVAPGGLPLLTRLDGSQPPRPAPPSPYAAGELVVAREAVRARRTPGFVNKAPDDICADYLAGTTLLLLAGPHEVDTLVWWRVGGISVGSQEAVGWVAEAAPNGVPLIGHPLSLPETRIPDAVLGSYLGLPFQGRYRIAQLWGENAAFYARFSYDGVHLKGHNGVDFAMPVGVNLLAVDGGQVLATGFEPNGFGHWVKLSHSWGESLLAHLDRVYVMRGHTVQRGTVLGTSGNSGLSSGPHLHCAIRIHPYERRDGWGGFSDPLPYLDPRALILPAYIQDPVMAGVPVDSQAQPTVKIPPSGMVLETAGMPRP